MSMMLSIPHEELAAFCHLWRIRELSLFGSLLGEKFSETSDIDLLIRFDDGARPTLFDMVRIQEGLEKIFGRSVDLISREAVEGSGSVRSRGILESARVIYGA